IDDGTSLFSDHLAIPHPRLRVDRFANRAEQTQARQVVLQRPLLTPFYERANRGWGCVEDIHSMTFDHGPKPIRLWKIRCTFIHQHRRAVREWSINDVAVSRDPTDVCRAPVDVFISDIEDPLRREMNLQEITRRRVQDTFGLTSRSRRVQNIERMFAIQLFRVAARFDSLHQLVPPEITLRRSEERRV